MKLSAYLSSHGSKAKLARAINAQPQLVWQWATGVRPVPPRRCLAIELETAGAVTRKDMRPDDWQDYWPELAQAPATTEPKAIETVAPPEVQSIGVQRRQGGRRERFLMNKGVL